jgi:hypothetical protein
MPARSPECGCVMTSRRVIFVFSLTAFFLLTCATSPTLAHGQQSWTIQTFAGGGPNNIPASGTAVGNVGGVATDSTGTLYISGAIEGEVWKLVNGNLIIVAGAGVTGSGQYSYDGDGGPATEATVIEPGQIAFDRNGDFFIPDSALERVRKVDRNGIITLIAGNGVFQGWKVRFRRRRSGHPTHPVHASQRSGRRARQSVYRRLWK